MQLWIENVCVSVKNLEIIRGVSLKIANGETVGIIGPNGSGKTTLFNAISGFMDIASGRILLDDQDVSTEPPYQRAHRGLGRVFQNFGVFHEMTVAENIRVACEAKGISINREKILAFLSQVGLQTKFGELASSLSGGQKRLLEIIRTVAAEAKVFLLDEPTAGVSPKMKSTIVDSIRMLQKTDKTIVIIEHDMNFITEFCSRIVVLDQGQLVLDGSPEEVRNSKLLQEIYFGVAA